MAGVHSSDTTFEVQRVDSKYLDLDEIIASSESTSCTFPTVDPDFFSEFLGILKPSQNSEGSTVDTPLWLIASVGSGYTINLPQAYCLNMQSVLNADAKNVNLYRLEQHFYSNGMHLCHLMKQGNPESAFNLSKCLLTTLTQRLGDIISNAAHARNKANKLDSLEMRVFQEAKRSKDEIDAWLRQDKTASSRKRKRNS